MGISVQGEPARDRTAVAAAPLGSAAGRQLVAELRNVKQVAGLSYARLEACTPYSRASLERYINGKLFPSRQAVLAITQACGADPQRAVELWEAASCGPDSQAGVDLPLEPTEAETPEESSLSAIQAPPRRARRGRRWLITVLAAAATALLLGLSWLARTVIAGSGPQPPPAAGCRDYYADIRAYTLGKMCWTATTVTVTGVLDNPTGVGVARAQLCLSNIPHDCLRVVDIAVADSAQTTHLQQTVQLPPGYGAWVRACVTDYCSPWK